MQISENEKDKRMAVYYRVVSLCEQHRTTPTALEKELSFGRGSIGKMKYSEMKQSRLQKIADHFNVPLEYLITGNDSKEDSEAISFIKEDPAVYYVLDIMRTMNENQRERLASYARLISKENEMED